MVTNPEMFSVSKVLTAGLTDITLQDPPDFDHSLYITRAFVTVVQYSILIDLLGNMSGTLVLRMAAVGQYFFRSNSGFKLPVGDSIKLGAPGVGNIVLATVEGYIR